MAGPSIASFARIVASYVSNLTEKPVNFSGSGREDLGRFDEGG
jgi:hypothetical protein